MAASPGSGPRRAGAANPPPLRTRAVGRVIAAAPVAVPPLCARMPPFARAGDARMFAAIAPPGSLAVQFFFVLSGFVMAVAHGADRGRDWHVAPRFLWRRACRIYPMYWLALLGALAVLGVPAAPRALRLLSLWPAWTGEAVPPAWTLRFEVEFYLLFALVLLPRAGSAVAAVWVVGTAANCFVPFECRVHGIPSPSLLRALSAPGTGHLFSGVNFFFFAGVAAGELHRRDRLGAPVLRALAAAGVVLVAACLPGERWGHDFGQSPFLPPLVGAGIGAALAGLAGLERRGDLRLPAGALAAGAISYPLYILHTVVTLLFSALAGPRRFGDGGLDVLAASIAAAIGTVSAAAAWGIDRPLQRRLRALGRPPGHPTAFDLLWREHP